MSERKKPARWRKYDDRSGWELLSATPSGMEQVLMIVSQDNPGEGWTWIGWQENYGWHYSVEFPTAESALADARKWWKENGT